MDTDKKHIEKSLKSLDDTWSQVRPGARICGLNQEGEHCVFALEDFGTPIATFSSDTEALTFAQAPQTIEYLTALVKTLVKERDEARTALKEISDVAEPAYDAFNDQKPVDMAAVLRTTHRWSHFIFKP